MRLGTLLVYFDTSPALRLLRSANAPFIIDFLDRQFKQGGRIAIQHSDLHSTLIEYGYLSGVMRPLAVATVPEGGLNTLGSLSKGM